MKLWLDIETRSPAALRRGTYVYAEQAEVILWQWAIDDGPVHVKEGTEVPHELVDADAECETIWAHNAQFDRVVLARYTPGFLAARIHRWRCTAALARMHGLPGGLDKLCEILKVPRAQAKMSNGKDLIKLFCVPYKHGYNDKTTHPLEWADFLMYGGQDVVAMREVYRRLPQWNATPERWALWHLDQYMNDAGVRVDRALAEALVRDTTAAQKLMAEQTMAVAELIGGDAALQSTRQVARLRAYLADAGISLPDLKAETVARRLEDESLPASARWLLTTRQEASRSSTTKAKRALECLSAGDRLRGTVTFCGAARTGRKSGSLFQPLNLPRPERKQPEIELAIELFKRGEIGLLDPEHVMSLGSDSLRGLLVASEGNVLIAADWSAIEARLTMWASGEVDALDAFVLNDLGLGPKPYQVTYARGFNVDPHSVKKDTLEYQIGKVQDLALSYYGGVGALSAMTETYGLRIEKLAAQAWPTIPAELQREAREAWKYAKSHYELEPIEFCTCWALVQIWRRTHPRVTTFWSEIQSAAERTTSSGVTVTCGPLQFDRVENWMRMRLPSGRYLCYPGMRFEDDGSLSFLGVNAYSHQWNRIGTYSGKLLENAVQAMAVDLHDESLVDAAVARLNPVLSVYDEIVCDTTPDRTVEELGDLMCKPRAWAPGLPLAAEGWKGTRYHK